jgi:hypothetical protein
VGELPPSTEQHNIFDFLVRDFETYAPDLAMVRKEPPEFLWGLVPIKKPRILSTRGGTSFWVHAGRDGIGSVVLTVPVTFPVEAVEHSDLLAGFPLPDIRGTVGTFSLGHGLLSPRRATRSSAASSSGSRSRTGWPRPC